MKDGDWSTFVQQFFKVNLDDVQKSFDTTYFKHKFKQSLKSVIKLLKWKNKEILSTNGYDERHCHALDGDGACDTLDFGRTNIST